MLAANKRRRSAGGRLRSSSKPWSDEPASHLLASLVFWQLAGRRAGRWRPAVVVRARRAALGAAARAAPAHRRASGPAIPTRPWPRWIEACAAAARTPSSSCCGRAGSRRPQPCSTACPGCCSSATRPPTCRACWRAAQHGIGSAAGARADGRRLLALVASCGPSLRDRNPRRRPCASRRPRAERSLWYQALLALAERRERAAAQRHRGVRGCASACSAAPRRSTRLAARLRRLRRRGLAAAAPAAAGVPGGERAGTAARATPRCALRCRPRCWPRPLGHRLPAEASAAGRHLDEVFEAIVRAPARPAHGACCAAGRRAETGWRSTRFVEDMARCRPGLRLAGGAPVRPAAARRRRCRCAGAACTSRVAAARRRAGAFVATCSSASCRATSRWPGPAAERR